MVVAGDAGVVGHPGRTDVGDELPVESVCAPEGFVVDEERLHRRAVRQPLGQLVADTGQRRVVHDSSGQRRGDRHDDAASAAPPGRHGSARRRCPAVCSISLHRCVEHDVVGDQRGQSLRDLAGAADEAGGLGAALGLGEQLGGHPAGLNREEQVQERHLDGRHREDPDGADLQQGPRDGRKTLGVVPGARGDGVPLVGARRQPRRLDGTPRRPARRGGAVRAPAPSARIGEAVVKLVLPQHSGADRARRTSHPRRTAGRSRTPSSSASRNIRSWVSPIHCAPELDRHPWR